MTLLIVCYFSILANVCLGETQPYLLSLAEIRHPPTAGHLSNTVSHKVPSVRLGWDLRDAPAVTVFVNVSSVDGVKWTMSVQATNTGNASPPLHAEARVPPQVLSMIVADSFKWLEVSFPRAEVRFFASDLRLFEEMWIDVCAGLRENIATGHPNSVSDFGLRLAQNGELCGPGIGDPARFLSIADSKGGLRFQICEPVTRRLIIEEKVNISEGELPERTSEIRELETLLKPIWELKEIEPGYREAVIRKAFGVVGYVPVEDRDWFARVCSSLLNSVLKTQKLTEEFERAGLSIKTAKVSTDTHLLNAKDFYQNGGWQGIVAVPGLGMPHFVPFLIELEPSTVQNEPN